LSHDDFNQTGYWRRTNILELGLGVPCSDSVSCRLHGIGAGQVALRCLGTGMPGDMVKVEGRVVWINEQYIGLVKPLSKAGIPLTPANPGLIPAGSFFMSTPSPDSLDSRYAISGNVQQSAIIGKAYAIF